MKDLIIIGAGPAGLSAAIYAMRAGLDTLVIEETGMGGGQILNTYEVDNYPGLPLIGGFDLGMKMKEHADAQGTEFVDAALIGIEDRGEYKLLHTSGGDYEARTVLIATGAVHSHLGVPGEEEHIGSGVSYCATCDGAFFKGRVTAVVGGGNTALEDAIFLSRGCEKVYIIHRRDSFRGNKKLQDTITETANIEICYDTVVTAVNGENAVESLSLQNVKDNTLSILPVSGVFMAVGTHPTVDFLKGLVDMDDRGYIKADESGITNVPGIFVAGDVRTKALRQVVTAASDGANAVNSVLEYLS